MRKRAPITISLAVLLLAAAGFAEVRLRERHEVAAHVLAEAQDSSAAFVKTFQGVHLDRELAHFAERRGILAQAHVFWLLRNALVLVAGLLCILAWWQAFRATLARLRIDEPQAAPSRPRVPAGVRPAPAIS
ncbi:MAG TPA: hypothetical protein VK013_04480 [Myxococcaceae bacterium]|nr:hypothetical protein [Myxococcaceae bacterium]